MARLTASQQSVGGTRGRCGLCFDASSPADGTRNALWWGLDSFSCRRQCTRMEWLARSEKRGYEAKDYNGEAHNNHACVPFEVMSSIGTAS